MVRQIGLFDATMIVMGGIIGAGIFMNPSVVARILQDPWLILGVWTAGGLIALSGAFVYAELSGERPHVGGQYAYFKEAFHPMVAFLYGWCLLLVGHSGGMAAVAITFATYLNQFTGLAFPVAGSALTALAVLTVVNCLGVRVGTTIQSALTVLKSVAIGALVIFGFLFADPAPNQTVQSATGAGSAGLGESSLLMLLGAAMVPVLFAYGGWQTACFVAGEVKNPSRNMPRALLFGILGVIGLYLATNLVCLHVLGSAGLAASATPAADVMRRALGDGGAKLISLGIVISTLGFLSQGMLTGPRVYYAMAVDGMFFKPFGRVHATTGAPVAAIALQGVVAMIIASSGRYDQILNYVVSVDFIFYGLTATCVFMFRRRARESGAVVSGFRVPFHPWTTLFFVVGCWSVVFNLVLKHATDSLVGFAILAAGVPAFFLWHRPGRGKLAA